MTATPRYFTGRVLKAAQDADLEVASMDDAAKFGTVFHRLTFSEAIKRDLLTDYQVAVVGVDNVTYGEWADKGVLVTSDGKKITDARTLAGQIGLAKAMRKYDLHRTISFHSRVARAREFAAEMPEIIAWMPARQRPRGVLWSRYVSGGMTAGERHVRLRHLSQLGDGERGLLTNARCLSEGVDVPTLDGVAFIDPRQSEVDIVQAVGRAIRKSGDKQVGTIVIPVFIDTNADPEVALDSSAFKPVWEIVKALRAHDEELAEQLDSLRRSLGKPGGPLKIPAKIHFDLPTKVSPDFADAFDVCLIESTTASWEFWFGLLEQYVAENGHTLVPQSYTANRYQLGKWVAKQRAKHAKGNLDTDRQYRLKNLPGWTWEPKADQWEYAFSRLLHYVESNGHASVPLAYTVDGYPLGRWVIKQRARYAEGALDGERQYRLKNLPAGHGTRSPRSGRWASGVWSTTSNITDTPASQCLSSSTATSSDSGWPINASSKPTALLTPVANPGSGSYPAGHGTPWPISGRRAYGGSWNTSDPTNTPTSPQRRPTRATAWVNGSRSNGRVIAAGNLTRNVSSVFQDIPEWTWTPIDDLWERGFQHLQQYIEADGHSQVPQTYRAVDGFNLGTWTNTQRVRYRNKALEADRIERLSEIRDWSWHTLKSKWEKGFQHLRKFAETHGNVSVPIDYEVDGFKLRDWLTNNRAKFDKLSPDRQRRLKSLPGWDDFSHNAKWEAGIQHLLNYVKENGTAAVPRPYAVGGYPLGAWVMTKRQEFKKGTLSPERKQLLRELPGWAEDAKAAKWEEGFGHLIQYVEENGHAGSPQGCVTNGYRLGAWIAQQRGHFAKQTLRPERRDRLDKLTGWVWETQKAKWEDAFRHLLR